MMIWLPRGQSTACCTSICVEPLKAVVDKRVHVCDLGWPWMSTVPCRKPKTLAPTRTGRIRQDQWFVDVSRESTKFNWTYRWEFLQTVNDHASWSVHDVRMDLTRCQLEIDRHWLWLCTRHSIQRLDYRRILTSHCRWWWLSEWVFACRNKRFCRDQ